MSNQKLREQVVHMNDQNVAILHYLMVPYRQWQYLTIFRDRRCLLELTELHANSVLPQIGALNQLLRKQRALTEKCWQLAEKFLAEYAEALGYRFVGRPIQQMDLQRLDNGSSANVVVYNRTCVMSLKKLFLFLQEQETPESVPYLRKRMFNLELGDLELEEDALGKQWVMHYRLHSDKIKQNHLKIAESSVTGSIYLEEDGEHDVQMPNLTELCFQADVYGYAEFLEFILPFTDVRKDYLAGGA